MTSSNNQPLPLSVDVVEISDRVAEIGEVYAVKPLAVLAMIDEGELDWKVVAIRADDPKADKVSDIEDVEREFPVSGPSFLTRSLLSFLSPQTSLIFAFHRSSCLSRGPLVLLRTVLSQNAGRCSRNFKISEFRMIVSRSQCQRPSLVCMLCILRAHGIRIGVHWSIGLDTIAVGM